MKKAIIFFLKIVMVLLLGIVFSTCSWIGLGGDISIAKEWSVSLDLNTSATNPNPLAYSANGKFDSNYDPFVIRYKNKIKGYKVNKIAYAVNSFTAPPGVSFANGTFVLSSLGKTIVSKDSINFQPIYGETELTNLNFDGLQDIVRKLNENGLIELDAKGTLSSTQVECKLTVVLYVTIVSEPL
jgi:hypothetical protein